MTIRVAAPDHVATVSTVPLDTDRGPTRTGRTAQGRAAPGTHGGAVRPPASPGPARDRPSDNSEVAMTVSRTARNHAQAMKGRITEELGRVTSNRRLQRRGRADRVSGSLKQAVEKARGAFRRNGGNPR